MYPIQTRCTFQCILVTDGRYSFVMFNYNLIQWTTGTTGGGSSSSGLGGTPAQVGFDAGDGIHFYSVTGSQTPGIINITQMSNIGIPGKFIFGVDQATIEQVTSAQTSTLALLSGRQTTEDTATEQIVTNCFGNPCQHGTCLSLEHTFMCLCDLGYEGLHCQINTNDCVTEPCLYGYCVDKVNDFVCECGMLFNGKRCTKMKTWAIITTTVSSVVLYVMSCCCCVFLCKQKNSDSKAKSSVIPHKQKPSPRGKPVPSKAGKRNAWVV
ncbi:sushi, nidogen and EGF-like domain-containing protein 1 [Mytilus galloprovincialis]|uniref:sushi, nidogen and EGF-like domain-containing protein 1 n=1 Tax=Mytilus galloprovincialis TaxID=29158 RepID=UPI003F7C2919